jgi:hypothetical protein
MAEQVDALHKASAKPVDIVSESEGALIAETYVMADQDAPVRSVVYASPLVAPGRVWYSANSKAGWGIASVAGMTLLSEGFQSVAPIDLSPHSAFLASLDRAAPMLESLYSCAIPGVDQFALLPLADAVALPSGTTFGFPTEVVPAFHGGLIASTAGSDAIAKLLEGDRPQTPEIWQLLEDTIGAASSAWQVPNLAETDYPQAPMSTDSCASLRRALATSLSR